MQALAEVREGNKVRRSLEGEVVSLGQQISRLGSGRCKLLEREVKQVQDCCAGLRCAVKELEDSNTSLDELDVDVVSLVNMTRALAR